MNGRGDHGSVQVRFAQPAIDLTKSGYQLSDPPLTGQRVGSDWTVLCRKWSGLYRGWIWPKLAGFGWKLGRSGWNLANLAKNWPCMARSWRDLTWSLQDHVGFGEIGLRNRIYGGDWQPFWWHNRSGRLKSSLDARANWPIGIRLDTSKTVANLTWESNWTVSDQVGWKFEWVGYTVELGQA